MSVRLRDQAVVLEPGVTLDRLTEEPRPDWDLLPASATPTRFQGNPVSSTEEVLTAETIVSRWRGYLPPMFDGVVAPSWRIRWDDADYTIDGDIERHKTRGCVRYLAVTLSRVEG